jgi:ankyrin repeat protein
MGEPLLRSHDRVLTEEGTAAAMEHGSAEPEPQVDEEKKEGGAKMLLIDQALLIAANTGDADEVRRCLRDGADPNAQIPGWRLTALYIAATENHVRCMEALAEAGGDLDQANVDGRTPLMAAARSGHTAAVEWLLGRGADWRLTDINGKTALDIAKQVNHVETAAVLERPDLLGVPSESFPQPQSGDPAVSAA